MKDSLVHLQSRLENFVNLYPNLSIRGGFVTNGGSAENSKEEDSGGIPRGVKRGIIESEIRQRRFGEKVPAKHRSFPVYIG